MFDTISFMSNIWLNLSLLVNFRLQELQMFSGYDNFFIIPFFVRKKNDFNTRYDFFHELICEFLFIIYSFFYNYCHWLSSLLCLYILYKSYVFYGLGILYAISRSVVIRKSTKNIRYSRFQLNLIIFYSVEAADNALEILYSIDHYMEIF